MTFDKVVATAAVEKLMAADARILQMLGIALDSIEAEGVRLSMRVSAEMVNSQQLCHGGFLFTLADTAGAYLAASLNIQPVSTEASISYATAAQLGEQVQALASREGATQRSVYTTVKIFGEDTRLVAIYRGTYLSRGRCVS